MHVKSGSIVINDYFCVLNYFPKPDKLLQMQPVHTDIKLIDVEKVIAGKNPKLLKILPGFLILYLKRILHQDELNRAISRNADKMGLDFLDAILKEFGVNIQVRGAENVDQSKNYTVASNHPLGGIDGMALMLTMGRINPNIVMTANDFLMHIDNLKSLFMPVNKHGSNAGNIAALNDAMSSEKVVLFFPAGLCSRKIGNQIIDLEWKKTFLSQSRKHDRDILPVHISGKNTMFFYNLAKLRAKLRVKANIEMLYLVDEMFKQKNKNITITFGKPINVSIFNNRLKDMEWAAQVKAHVYKLEKDINAEFIPTY